MLVVGGGPAGLAAAIAARRNGFSVTVADGAAPPFDKACGEGLMPQGVLALRRLGVEIAPSECHPFQGIEFFTKDRNAGAKFSKGTGLGVRRTKLHALLTRAASDSGVTLLWKAPVAELKTSSAMVGGQRFSFDYLIGADGGSSTVRRTFGFATDPARDRRFGFRQHFAVALWSDSVEVHWAPGLQLYVTPVGAFEVGVAVISRDPKLRLKSALAHFPELAKRLRLAEPSSTERGSVTVSQRLPLVTQGRIALVGDASGTVDAITGDGLSLAFEQCEALAGALATGNLATYEKAHRRILRLPSLLSSVLLTMDRYPVLNQLAIRTLAAKPFVFSQLLNLQRQAQ